MQFTEKREFNLNMNEEEAKQLMNEIVDINYEDRGEMLQKIYDVIWERLNY